MKKLSLFFALFLLFFSKAYSQATSQCLGCAKVIYIVDNSGSVSGGEFTDMKTSIDAISASILGTYSNVELSVVQYIRTGGINDYQITVPFTNTLGTIQTWGRAWNSGSDHLPGSFESMRLAGIWNAGGSMDLVSDGCVIKFFVFTDAWKENSGSCISNTGPALTTAPTAMPGFGEYNFMKTTYGADFTVYHVSPGTTQGPPAAAAGGAIASVGGTYATAIDPNPGDPQGSGVLPRKYSMGNSFLLTAAEINAIVLNINPASTGSLLFTVGFSNRDTICLGDTTAFSSTAQAPVQFSSWDFGDGSPIVTGALDYDHLYASAGTYTVTHIVHLDSVCKDTAIRTIEVVPHVSAVFSVDSICVGSDNTIVNSSIGTITNTSWDFGDGSNGNQSAATFTHTYVTSGDYTIELIVENALGCADTATEIAVVDDMPVADFTFTDQCLGTQYQFNNTSTFGSPSNTSGCFWLWNLGNSSTSFLENPTTNYVTDGTKIVSLSVTSPGGCVDQISKQIEVYPLPVADFIADTVCFGKPTNFTDLSSVTSGTINTWRWDTDSVYLTQNPNHIYDRDGVHAVRLTVTSNYGCVDDILKPILVHPVPTADFSYGPLDLSLFKTDACFANGSTQADSYLWDFDFDNQTSTATDPCIQFPIGVMNDYNVKLIAYNQFGCVDSITKPVPVGDEFLLYVPNAFTPDNDDLNEVFMPTYSGVTEVKFYIFNRWGDLLFSTEEQDEGWDGSFNGLKSKQDVYVYRIIARDIYGKRHNEIGHFSLLR